MKKKIKLPRPRAKNLIPSNFSTRSRQPIRSLNQVKSLLTAAEDGLYIRKKHDRSDDFHLISDQKDGNAGTNHLYQSYSAA